MKLKRVLSLCLAAATVATCSSVVSAADANTTSFGTPISLTTGAEVEELTVGDFIAIPVDVTTSTGKLTSWTPRLVLSDALEAGIEDASMSDDQYANLEALGGEIVTNEAGMDYYVKNIFKSGRKKTFLGSWNVNPKQVIDGVPHFSVGWYDTAADAYTDEPECWFLCTVKKDVTADDLNNEAFYTTKSTQLADNINGLASVSDVKGSAVKFNATQGAFKVVLNADALPAGNWVQGLYAQVGSTKQEITACVHADGTTTYEFPVRVNSATGATNAIDVDIYATTTADEAGATTSTDKKIGSINLTMDGTVTSYNTVNGTIAK